MLFLVNSSCSCLSRDTQITRAVVLYLLRPNVKSKRFLDKQLKLVLPKSLDSRFAIGIPIRGSDKCGKESNCLEFDEYMNVAREAWEGLRAEQNQLSFSANFPVKGSLILTTEDRKLFQQRLNYSAIDFPFNFVVNENDVMQSSGSYWNIARSTKESPDEIVLSSLIAMKMQFHAKYVYGNCCSNFHRLIFEMIQLGCGFHQPQSIWRCYPNICCSWTSEEECEEIHSEYKRRASNESLTHGRSR